MMYTFKLIDTESDSSTWMIVGCRDGYDFLRNKSLCSRFAVGPISTITVDEAEEVRVKRTEADFALLLSFNEFIDSTQ